MAGERRTFRALGGVDDGTPLLEDSTGTSRAYAALRDEFDRAFALKESLRGEQEASVSPTGRRTTAGAEAKLRTLVASVEGASRFAIRLGLLDPGQVRALWSEAIDRGLYDGWDGGQSAYAPAAGGDDGAPRHPPTEAPAERTASDPQRPQRPDSGARS